MYKVFSFFFWLITERKEEYIYISNHPNNAREVNKICAILKNFDLNISKFRTLAKIDNDAIHRLTEDLSSATHYLVFLSRDYSQDEFCQFGKYSMTTKI